VRRGRPIRRRDRCQSLERRRRDEQQRQLVCSGARRLLHACRRRLRHALAHAGQACPATAIAPQPATRAYRGLIHRLLRGTCRNNSCLLVFLQNHRDFGSG
jgi:hypothetical protein